MASGEGEHKFRSLAQEVRGTIAVEDLDPPKLQRWNVATVAHPALNFTLGALRVALEEGLPTGVEILALSEDHHA